MFYSIFQKLMTIKKKLLDLLLKKLLLGAIIIFYKFLYKNIPNC